MPYGNAIDDKCILPYLLNTHKHEEALSVIHKYEDFLNNEGDSITLWMLNMRINEGIINTHLGDFSHAKENYRHLRNIVDKITEMRSRADMNSTNNHIKDRDKLESRSQLLIFSFIGGLVFLVVSLLVLYYNRIIWRRNRLLQHTLDRLAAYSNVPVEHGDVTEPIVSEDERLFVEMDRRVTQERLFLNPTLSREDLMAIMGVGKNHFVSIMGRFCDEDNVTQYINQKRLEYATLLMRQHPNYTLQAIMSECGMTSAATFNRAFKYFYGVTPSEYRKDIEQTL